jgi:hypothetical protein
VCLDYIIYAGKGFSVGQYKGKLEECSEIDSHNKKQTVKNWRAM